MNALLSVIIQSATKSWCGNHTQPNAKKYAKLFIKAGLSLVFLQETGRATRPERSTRSPGCYWSPAGTECSRAFHPRGGAAQRNHTPGPTSLKRSCWSPDSAALKSICVPHRFQQCEHLLVMLTFCCQPHLRSDRRTNKPQDSGSLLTILNDDL